VKKKVAKKKSKPVSSTKVSSTRGLKFTKKVVKVQSPLTDVIKQAESKKIKVGIAGAAGYTGGELIRLLINHPGTEIVFAQSSSNADRFVHEVHTDLLGDTTLKFSSKISEKLDVLFLCYGHGDSFKFMVENKINKKIKVIDLSQDFRYTNPPSIFPRQFVYGLPELNREKIRKADNIANPGCFATCIQLGILPLAANILLRDEVHVSATTGSTGAGQSLSATSHFSWRNDNQSVYKAFQHQHLKEIDRSIKQLHSSFDKAVNFIPYRGGFTRGILASIYINSDLSLENAVKLYQEYYKNHPFVHISKSNIDLKQVVNTNKCLLYLEKHGNKLMIVSIIDNLLKGSSGQAVQNMNLMFGLDETTGLKLKASTF
jgi:N-acetyl-gamma-glutamyl-phosphate reductase